MLNLKNQRKVFGITQAKLSVKTGVAQCYLSKLERGLKKPNEATRNKIESVLGNIDWSETIKIKTLLGGTLYDAEQLVHKLILVFQSLQFDDKLAIRTLVKKYFRN